MHIPLQQYKIMLLNVFQSSWIDGKIWQEVPLSKKDKLIHTTTVTRHIILDPIILWIKILKFTIQFQTMWIVQWIIPCII